MIPIFDIMRISILQCYVAVVVYIILSETKGKNNPISDLKMIWPGPLSKSLLLKLEKLVESVSIDYQEIINQMTIDWAKVNHY